MSSSFKSSQPRKNLGNTKRTRPLSKAPIAQVQKKMRAKASIIPAAKRGKNFHVAKPETLFPTHIRGIHRLSHREIIDDVADIEHQILMTRNGKPHINYPLSKKVRKHCIEKGVTIDDIMKAARSEDGKIKIRPPEVKMHTELMKRKAEASKLDREISSQQAELKALSKQFDKLREQYAQSVRSSESNRVMFQNSVLKLRDSLWRETSCTANTSQKLEELRVYSQELSVHTSRRQQHMIELESQDMHLQQLKEIAKNTSPVIKMEEYPPLIESLSDKQRNLSDQLKRELKRSQQEAQFISRELEQTIIKHNELQYQIERQNKINNDLTTREKMRSKELEHVQDEVHKLEEKLKELREEREEQLARVEKARKRNESLQKVITCAEKRVKESEDGVRKSIMELMEIKEEILAMQADCTEGWQETTAEKERCASASSKAQELTRKHDSYLYRSKNTMDRVVQRKKQLEKEEAELKERLKIAEEKTANVEKEIMKVQKKTEEAAEQILEQRKKLLEQVAKNSQTIMKEFEQHLNNKEEAVEA